MMVNRLCLSLKKANSKRTQLAWGVQIFGVQPHALGRGGEVHQLPPVFSISRRVETEVHYDEGEVVELKQISPVHGG